MTCIVGIVANGTIYIGADSAGTDDSGMQTIRDDRKVFQVGPSPNDGRNIPRIVIGGTTSFRLLQRLQHALKVPVYDNTMSIEKYLVTDFVDAVRVCFKEGGYERKDDGEEQGADFILGVLGNLYHVAEDYQVAQPRDGYYATGSGAKVAMGALFSTKRQKFSPEKRLILALEAAAHHCSSVRPPFIIETLSIDNGKEEGYIGGAIESKGYASTPTGTTLAPTT
jgi:ATP-dependent protease HslVU (ClpYQ) peptidase subunit